MKFKHLLACSIAAGSFYATEAASTIVIDNYDTAGFDINSTGALVTDGADVVPGTDTTLTGTVMRTVGIDADGDRARVHNNLAKISYSNDDGISSFVNFAYTFPAQNIGVGTAFSFQLVNSDAGTVNYLVTVTDGVNTSTSAGSIPIVPSVFNVTFASFSGSANFALATGITFELTTITAGSDVSIDAFGIDLPGVPEPSTYAAVGFMGLAAFGAYRRSRK